MARQRKQFLLRIPHELYDLYEAWAADELRSVNAQLEAVLTDAARRAGGGGPGGAPPPPPRPPPRRPAPASGTTALASPDGVAGGS